MAASVLSSVAVYSAACNRNATAIVKHPACAAAINSSGLVPFSFSNRVLNEYGVFASTPESDERSPFPARPLPRQTALALRIMGKSPLSNASTEYPGECAVPAAGENADTHGRQRPATLQDLSGSYKFRPFAS